MGDMNDQLREVMGLLSVATKGEWFSESVRGDMGWDYFQLRSDDNTPFLDTLNSEMAMISTEGDEDGSYSYDETGLHDTRAIAAAVNFLRQHGPALLGRQEGEDRLRDLHHAIRLVYGCVPNLPIDESTMDAATDALHNFCLMVGIHEVDVDSPIDDAARSGGGG